MSNISAEDPGPLPPNTPAQIEILSTAKTFKRLNQIDKVRALGVGEHISLPQLVVCGDQSAGKSSVLEGVTGIPFPRNDGLCTRFATEIILRHDTERKQIRVSIHPSYNRTSHEKRVLKKYKAEIASFEELPNIIVEVSKLMGLRGYVTAKDAPAFASDILRVEYIGNTGLHLTVVDLPGLIPSSEDEKGAQLVTSLVDSYLESSRTVIMAVVQAGNDIETQSIIRHARKYDKKRARTVGIVTKPDLINEETEERIAALTRNRGQLKLGLGFFLVKNPTPKQLKAGITMAERIEDENLFFSSERWKAQDLNRARVGMKNLRIYLQELLDDHIESELPKVRQELQDLLTKSTKELVSLGQERSSIIQIRTFLTDLAMDFYNLTRAALIGNYDGDYRDFFTGAGVDRRLRAKVHECHSAFATFMSCSSAKRVIGEEDEEDELAQSERANKRAKTISFGTAQLDGCQFVNAVPDDSDQVEPGNAPDTESASDDGSKEYSMKNNWQIAVSEEEMEKWILKVYRSTRGLELAGNYNHALLSELFHEQAENWEAIATNHVEKILDLVNEFARSALKHAISDETVRTKIGTILERGMAKNKQNAFDELKNLLRDEKGHPMTYNHYYTDTIQKTRQETCRAELTKMLEGYTMSANEQRNMKINVAAMVNRLQQVIVADMEKQTCVEALDGLNAYYKVARKTFVDNLCRQVIERHILSGLGAVFSPAIISQLSEEEVLQLGAESKQARERRRELESLSASLEASIKELDR